MPYSLNSRERTRRKGVALAARDRHLLHVNFTSGGDFQTRTPQPIWGYNPVQSHPDSGHPTQGCIPRTPHPHASPPHAQNTNTFRTRYRCEEHPWSDSEGAYGSGIYWLQFPSGAEALTQWTRLTSIVEFVHDAFALSQSNQGPQTLNPSSVTHDLVWSI